MALSVTQRTRELGIRLALGAARADVFRLVLGQGALLIGIGLVLGLVGALAAGQRIVQRSLRCRRRWKLPPWRRRLCRFQPSRCWPVFSRRAVRRGSIRWWRCAKSNVSLGADFFRYDEEFLQNRAAEIGR